MPSARDPRSPVRWRPSPRRVAALMAAAFVGISGFLGLRIATGDDPAIHQASIHGSATATTSGSGGSATSAVQSVISSVVSLVSDGEDHGDDGGPGTKASTANPSTSSSGG